MTIRSRMSINPESIYIDDAEKTICKPDQVEFVKNKLITKKFSIKFLKQGELQKFFDNGLESTVKQISIEECDLNREEFYYLLNQNYLKFLSITNTKVIPPPKIHEIMNFAARCTAVILQIENLILEKDWVTEANIQNAPGRMKKCILNNVKLNFDIAVFDKFVYVSSNFKNFNCSWFSG